MGESWTIVVVALIVGVTGVITPAFLAWLAGHQRRAEKAEDWARQDEVAERVAEAAEKAAGAARLLLAANERVAASATVTNDKLDVIHTLVNSNMTAVLQGELSAVEALEVGLAEVIKLREAAGMSASGSRADAETLRAKLNELRAVLTERMEQTRVANLQAIAVTPPRPSQGA